MPLMQWTENLSVNVKQFDAQHVKLVAMVNDLHDAMKLGKGDKALVGILNGLASYTATHFADEERLMSKYAYPGIAQHRREHEKLIEQVQALQKKLEVSGGALLTLEVMKFLKEWLVNHIQGEDKKYATFFNAKGVC